MANGASVSAAQLTCRTFSASHMAPAGRWWVMRAITRTRFLPWYLRSFRDAELLTDALDDGLSGRQSLNDALAMYGRRRDERAAPGFEMSCQFATIGAATTETQQLFAALRDNQEQTDRLFGTVAGTVRP